MVKIDPLWIDAQVPLEFVKRLKANGTVEVVFNSTTTVVGEIENIAAVADAASNTLRVRISVSNNTRRPAGERVQILF